MYFSINKKIFYALFLLLIFLGGLFLTIFLQLYGDKYEENQHSAILRNQYVVELLHENINLQREILKLSNKQNQPDLELKEIELKRQQTISEQLQKSYNLRWSTFIEGGKLIALSSLLSLALIFILGFLLQRWVILPVRQLAEACKSISKGDYTQRIKIKQNKLTFDELDLLNQTFNTMINNIQQNINEIKNTEMFLQSLLDAIPDGIRVIDRQHNIVMVNKAYQKQTGDTGLSKCYMVYGNAYPCPQGTVSCPLREIKNCKSRSVNIIHNLCGRPLAINAAPLKIQKNGEDNDFYVVEIMRDLSEDIRFSHEQKISSLGFLATTVAHEMKNNLGAIRMILENLLNKDNQSVINQADKEKYMQMIYKQIITSMEMPESLLRLARNKHEKQETIDVNNAITETLSLLDYEAKRNGISIQHYNNAPHIKIEGNEADFKMIILNLSQNAFKAMLNGGTFEINVSKNKNMVILKIKDTGIGIAPEKINHIFEPFYSDGPQARYKGTGLGLAIVKNLVDKLKGSISVNSQLNAGTIFEIKIPKSKRNNLQS